MAEVLIFSKRKTFSCLKRYFILTLFLLAVLSLSGECVFATEGGGNAYPTGAEDFMSGAVPPPGTYFINYFLYYSPDEFKNVSEDIKIEGLVNVFRLIHITKHKIFGGFWGMHIFVPVWNLEVTNPLHPIGKQSRAGLGDIIIDPFILSWHTKNWHFATGLDIYLPTGRYDKNDLANISRNYFTFEPIFAFTYLSDSGYEVSSKFMYDFNTENEDTDYHSGQEFHFDYTVGKKFGNLSAGVGGYYYKQITNDKQNNQKVGDGNKGQAIAYGPQIKYDYKNMSFILKYQIETDVENKPEGDKVWFKFVYAF